MYGRQTETAIAAMSRLAEVYDGGSTRLSSAEIAEARTLQAPSVAKVLTVLSQAGLVTGTPGPGGGYCLARHPREISLSEVSALFERTDDSLNCPFGGGVCGVGEPCPLHDKLVRVQESMDDLLYQTTFEAFRKAYQDEGKRPTAKETPAPQRQSFRAIKPRREG